MEVQLKCISGLFYVSMASNTKIPPILFVAHLHGGVYEMHILAVLAMDRPLFACQHL